MRDVSRYDRRAVSAWRDQGWKASVAFVAAATALVYIRPIVLHEVFFRRDISRFIHPLFAEVRRRVWAGELPLWSPSEYGGAPLLADVTTATLYPPNLLLLWLAPAAASAWCPTISTLIAAAGASQSNSRLGG